MPTLRSHGQVTLDPLDASLLELDRPRLLRLAVADVDPSRVEVDDSAGPEGQDVAEVVPE